MEKRTLTPRNLYTDKIVRLLDRSNMVIVTGVRRSGKSCIAAQLEAELREKYGDTARIARYNFETVNAECITGDDMIGLFERNHIPDKTNFILLDEVTRAVEWEKAINHFSRFENCKLILFSSNRRIVSKELTAVRENRCEYVHVLPLSLPEFITFQGFQELTPADTPVCEKKYHRFDDRTCTVEEIYKSYITYGGLPVLKPEYMDRELAWVVADGSYATIVTRDILEIGSGEGASAITDTALLRSVIAIMAKSVGDNISATWIGKQTTKYLQRTCSTKTVESYMRALLNAHLFYVSERFDVRANQTLKTLAKYYIVDAGLHNYITGVRAEDEGRLLENKVFFELVRRGYQVFNGKLGSEEITLIAKSGQDKVYIQVADDSGEEHITALLSPLRRLRDYYPKVVISFGHDTQTMPDGIVILNALEFLMGSSWAR